MSLPSTNAPTNKDYRVLAVIFLGMPLLFVGVIIFLSLFVEDTRSVPGDARRFDPVASFSQVQNFAGDDANLTSMSAMFVKSDGTLDLKVSYKPSPNVTYTFLRKDDEPKDAPPIGVGQDAAQNWARQVTITITKPWRWMSVTKRSEGWSAAYPFINFGMRRETAKPVQRNLPAKLPPPTCALRDLWQTAIKAGAPSNAVAVITYDENGYQFDINGADMYLKFNQECQLK